MVVCPPTFPLTRVTRRRGGLARDVGCWEPTSRLGTQGDGVPHFPLPSPLPPWPSHCGQLPPTTHRPTDPATPCSAPRVAGSPPQRPTLTCSHSLCLPLPPPSRARSLPRFNLLRSLVPPFLDFGRVSNAQTGKSVLANFFTDPMSEAVRFETPPRLLPRCTTSSIAYRMPRCCTCHAPSFPRTHLSCVRTHAHARARTRTRAGAVTSGSHARACVRSRRGARARACPSCPLHPSVDPEGRRRVVGWSGHDSAVSYDSAVWGMRRCRGWWSGIEDRWSRW